MEPDIRQYESISSAVSVSWPKTAGVAFAIGCAMFILLWAENGLFHSHESLDRAISTSVIFGVVFVVFRFSDGIPQRLIIGHDFIEARTRIGGFRFKQHIRRDQVKSISENNGGIYIRDRGRFAARMLGLIFIPATTLEYKEIRSELAQWTPINVEN